jgi:glycerol-3-phosphate O-acyltransferase
MSSLSLADMCQNNIANQIFQAPPVIQEMVVETTTTHLKEEAMRTVLDNINSTLVFLVPDLVRDRVRVITTDNAYAIDFFALHPYVDPSIMRTAHTIAHTITLDFEDQLTDNKMHKIVASYPPGSYSDDSDY